MSGEWVGIDAGGTTTRVGVAGTRGLAGRAEAATPATMGEFVATVEGLCRDLGVAGAVRGVGVGVPGVAGEWVPNVSYLASPDLAKALSRRLGGPVSLGNDAQLALLGEAREGAASGCRSALLVTVGTGVGGALLLGRRIVRGAHGSAGAMGWLVLDPSDAGDPDRGALERRLSGPAWDRAGAALTPPRDSYGLIASAHGGDRDAEAIVARMGRDLGAAVAGAGSLVDPEVVVVAGGLAAAFDVLHPAMAAGIERWGSPQLRRVPVRLAALGADAGMVGAGYAAREGGEAWW